MATEAALTFMGTCVGVGLLIGCVIALFNSWHV